MNDLAKVHPFLSQNMSIHESLERQGHSEVAAWMACVSIVLALNKEEEGVISKKYMALQT